MPKRVMTEELEAKIIKLRSSGHTPIQIAGEVKVAVNTVRNVLSDSSFTNIKESKSFSSDLYSVIARLIKKQRPVDIAADYGVSRQYIHYIKQRCKKAGIPV